MYRLQSWILLLGLLGLFAGIAHTFLAWPGVFFVAGLGLVLTRLSVANGAAIILRMHRARPLARWEAPRLYDMALQLARRASIAPPTLMYYPGDMPNAFALGLRQGQGVVAVSSALLRLLDERQVYGVLAHEMAHLKNRDSSLSVAAGMLVQGIGLLSQLASFALLLFVFLGGEAAAAGIAPLLVLLALVPLAAMLLQAGLMRTRERLADRDAARLTRDPRGLASALKALQEYSRYLAGFMRRFRFLYTAEEDTGLKLLRTHPPTQERISALLALEERRYKVAV